MAESVVSFVLEKLGDAVVKEVLHLYGVSDQVEKVSRELTRIQAFLKDADTNRIVDERQKQWVKEVRDVAYSIEDVIDDFLSEAPEKKRGKREAVKRWLKKVKRLPVVRRLGNEINKIEARILEIEASRGRLGVSNLGEGNEGEIEQPVRRIVLPDVEEDGIVGFEADREKIVNLLLDEKTTRCSVISIVGTGGLGKTTLARKVYNSEAVKQQFDSRMWVVISPKFELIDIVREIAEQLNITPPNDFSEQRISILYQFLTNKRYLLVLDDIWRKNMWTQIKGIFPNANNGSRILITTRFSYVAEDADPMTIPYNLQFLTEESSIELLFKKAIPNRNANEMYPNDLYNIGIQFVKKCGCLPLALVVLGSLLSRKPTNYVSWSRVMQTMDWGTDGEECMAVLTTSYDDLPFALKSCFMYFAAFPEGYEIDARRLSRMWIAEDFIPQEENRTLEDTAERILDDLVQRSMIQVSKSYDGFITHIRIHALLLDLAIRKAKDDNFLVACSKIEDVQNCSQTRRLAIQYNSWWSTRRHEDEEHYGRAIASAIPNLRSLLCFQLMPKISQLMHLKVLSVMDCHVGAPELKEFRRLNRLRYIDLPLRVNSNEDVSNFGEFIGGMRFLRTLALPGEWTGELPDCVWHIKTIRHIILPRSRFTSGPPPLVDLVNLQLLSGVTDRESWKTEGLPKLPNVTILEIGPRNRFQWDAIISLLGTLEKLISLQIIGDDIPLNIIDMRGLPFYQHLQFLDLWNEKELCQNKIALDVGMLPIHLAMLRLRYLQFGQDPMLVLEKLENLRSLYIQNCKFQQLCCSVGGFGRLEELEFRDSQVLGEWKIEEGAMPVLKQLAVYDCPQLCVPPGLQHLTSLQKLIWQSWDPDHKISETMENEIRTICKHVPFINIKSM